MANKFFLPVLVLSSFLAQGQKLKKEDKELIANLQQHIQYLADDQLEGRRTGTPGEARAAAYITKEFEKAGLEPKGTEGFLQAFEVSEGRQLNPDNSLEIDGKSLTLQKDYFPLVYSPNLKLEALPSLSLQEPDMPWFFDLKELLETHSQNPHFDVYEAVQNKAREVAKKGATALFIFNTGNARDGLSFDARDHSATLSIPVIYIAKEAAKRFFADPSAMLDIKLVTHITEKKRKGTNVIGFIDNNASATVVLGAHFDHLGYGEDGGSREVEKKGQIHNGADDNASGTAALIEMAKAIRSGKSKNNNYLFIAFSGEELGLYGSKFFVEHPTIDLNAVNYMINMDMVGRLNDSSKVVTVGGYGTSPEWGVVYSQQGKNKLWANDMSFRFDSSGTGPSDHTSFYLKNIPVLFYFTGLHSDYHKPTDDYDKINFSGEMNLVKHILSLVQTEDKTKTKLVFTKTREAQTTTSARFSVTLGIMPDYTYSGTGVRVDGVSENKPAQKAGLKQGDVITKLGEQTIVSLESYMQALGTFKKGEKTTVIYNRSGQMFSATVEF